MLSSTLWLIFFPFFESFLALSLRNSSGSRLSGVFQNLFRLPV